MGLVDRLTLVKIYPKKVSNMPYQTYSALSPQLIAHGGGIVSRYLLGYAKAVIMNEFKTPLWDSVRRKLIKDKAFMVVYRNIFGQPPETPAPTDDNTTPDDPPPPDIAV